MLLQKSSLKVKLGEFKSDQKYFVQINQEILEASKNNHSSWRALQLMYTQLANTCGRFLQIVLFKVLHFKLLVKKHCVAKILQGI